MAIREPRRTYGKRVSYQNLSINRKGVDDDGSVEPVVVVIEGTRAVEGHTLLTHAGALRVGSDTLEYP